MSNNIADLQEMICPECQRPFAAEPVEGTDRYRFFGCRCNQTKFDLREAVAMIGAEGAPTFFYERKASPSPTT
jgi:hypothetical protein